MSLLPSSRLGPYEIVSAIGAGGMGEVYRARDTRLDRTVAIKILPTHLSSNTQARERFDREAKAISSLSHPHICPLYDVGHQDGIDFLVMEYLEGDTLSQRLKKGPLPPDQILQYAIQITDALDTAHRHGVIHRDLKPGNIMLTKTGAKLLDFGLAKVQASEAAAGMTQLPTQTTPLTAEGTILGTMQYMAPEQLEGKEADARTDIFALGAVLYEMATGRRAFEGKSRASLIAAILERNPPPVSTVQPLTSPALDHVVRTCLAKDPDARWQIAHDILIELKWIAEAGAQAGASRPAASRKSAFLPWAFTAALAIALAALATVYFAQRPEEAQRIRFEVPVPDKVNLSRFDFPVLSPDGRKYVFSGQDARGQRRLWLHALDSTHTEPLAGTDGAYNPFWSPDGRFVAFFSEDRLKKMNLADGAVQTLCDAPGASEFPRAEGSWSQRETILFSTRSGLMRTSPAGGDVTPVTEIRGTRWLQHSPQFLPDGTHFLYQSLEEKPGIYLGSLGSKDVRRLIATASNVNYAPPGLLVYARGSALFAQSFDVKTLQVTGEPVQIAQPVRTFVEVTRADFSVSRNGVLIYRSSLSSEVQLAWYSREGRKLQAVGEPGAFNQIELSPDEKRLVVERLDTRTGGIANLWTLELASGVFSRQTFASSKDMDAIWSPDGRELIFLSVRNGKAGIYRKAIGGGQEHVVAPDQGGSPYVWLKDGKSIVLVGAGAKSFLQLSTAGHAKPVVLFESEFPKDALRVSRDEHWVAYSSTESGRSEVYIATFPNFQQRQQVSSNGGCQPFWRNDGKELFFLSLDGKLMAAETDVHEKQSLAVQVPRALFDVPFQPDPTLNQYSVAGDGKRFLFEVPVYQGPEQFTVILNWQAGLKK